MDVGDTLTSCPRCESSLIQIESARLGDRGMLLRRHCPECEHRDMLSTAVSLGDLLVEHATELSRGLEELADQLAEADELWLSDVH